MSLLDVVVPAGVGAGDNVEFTDADGNALQAVVPAGLSEGDTFQVEVGSDGSVQALETLARAAADDDGASVSVMDKFAVWFERESVGDQIDQFVTDNAHLMGEAQESHGMQGEQSHDVRTWPGLVCPLHRPAPNNLIDANPCAPCTLRSGGRCTRPTRRGSTRCSSSSSSRPAAPPRSS
jgi:hypothetical protein